MTRDDGEKRRRTDDVIDEAQGNRANLRAAIAKLETYIDELNKESARLRGVARKDEPR